MKRFFILPRHTAVSYTHLSLITQLVNRAVNTPIGNAIIIAITEVKIVPSIIGRIPKEGFLLKGFHTVPVIKLTKE